MIIDIEKLEEGQVACYCSSSQFRTGRTLCIIRKGDKFVGRWPKKEDFEVSTKFIEEAAKRKSLTMPDEKVVLKKDEYVFLLDNREPVVGTDKEIKRKLKDILGERFLGNKELELIKDYIEMTDCSQEDCYGVLDEDICEPSVGARGALVDTHPCVVCRVMHYKDGSLVQNDSGYSYKLDGGKVVFNCKLE